MRLSVVVTTYDRPDDLVECLRSLNQQFEPLDEVIVVDDGEVELTRERLEESNLTDVAHVAGTRAGLPVARNLGAESATGDVVAFVDDDVVLPPNWSQKLIETYEAYPDAAGVGGFVLNYNPEAINKANTGSFAYRLLQGFRQAFLTGGVGIVSPVGILWAPHVFMTEGPRTVDALQGCNMSFRADTLAEYEFDKWYGRSGSSALEEIDFAVQVSSDGGTLVYNPEVVALHKRTIAIGPDQRSGGPNYGSTTNLAYFVLNHPEMGVVNFLLLALGVTLYSLLRLDVGHLVAMKEGFVEYRGRGGDDGDR